MTGATGSSETRPGPGAGGRGYEGLRVLYSFPHILGAPGIGTTAWCQVQGLVDHGVEVDLVCTSVGRQVPGLARVTETLVAAGRRIPHRALGVDRAYRYHDRRAARALARRRDEIQIVHTWPGGCLATLARARQLGVPSVRELPSPHTADAMAQATADAALLGIELPPGHSHRFDEHRLARELAEFEAADALLAPSEYVERTFAARGWAPERLLRHQYGFDPTRFAPDPARPARHDGGLVALFAGRGEPNKGLHFALRAWVDAGPAERGGRFVICGRILPAYRPMLEPMISHPSVEERGFEDDMPGAMAAADILMLPSTTEGSALVTYEAQGSGCVLLVSDAAGAVCDDGVQGFVHPAGDVETLTRQLRQLDEDRDLLARMRASTFAQRDQLTWDHAAELLAGAYLQLVTRMGEPRRQEPLPEG